MARYADARRASQPFGKEHTLWQTFEQLQQLLETHPVIQRHPSLRVTWSVGRGNWARVPWLTFLDERETNTTQHGVYVVYLFREDMTGVYLTFNQGVTDLQRQHGTPEARSVLRSRAKQLAGLLPASASGFRTEGAIDLRTRGNLGRAYEHSTIAYRLYEVGELPEDDTLFADLEALLEAYEVYIHSDLRRTIVGDPAAIHSSSGDTALEAEPPPSSTFELATGFQELRDKIQAEGYVYPDWQLAQYVTALRTKPFVILAGITGTGKSKLPSLVAEHTGGSAELIPVRPDWTDSADVLGYTDLQGTFRPGALLELAHRAMGADDVHEVAILDEMNLARVEHYFAEVLSRIEDRRPAAGGGYASTPLLQGTLPAGDAEWQQVHLPSNLALVGTVNMDESAHGFSRKVLDRAFTLELSEVALERWAPQSRDEAPRPQPWPVSAWQPRAARLAELDGLTPAERDRIQEAIDELVALNRILTQAQLQVGYRTRDEVALFVLHAEVLRSFFRTETDEPIDPLDLALQMKILPRIVGGSTSVQRVLLGILGWAYRGTEWTEEDEAQDLLDHWAQTGRPSRVPDARYPGLAARTCLMWDRLLAEGFTSYWL
ncbi:MrcB family domain-containing protein [Halorhodospira neutriphila]|uniref:MrcB family domain-containing protein n=1 Tax=Halorhodospira neutriphila TaxID=168379 RepID=UPI00190445E9|nr:DUF3578 domain-containing protein [Halorhodospira neutriphila]